MTSAGRKSLVAVAATATLVLGGLTVLPAAADSPSEWVGAGQLTLSPGSGTVSYGDQAQSLAQSGTCDLTTSGADLLGLAGSINGSAKKVGFRNGQIGVQERLTSFCNLVDVYSSKGPETLSLSLGSDLVGLGDRPLLADSATLKLSVSSLWWRKAEVQAKTLLDGAEVGTFSLAQGAGDCDVHDGAVCALTMAGAGRFDEVQLTAKQGVFSLGDSSTFDLVSEVDKALDCTANSTFGKDNATVQYLGNADGTECTGFGVVLTAGDDEVQFLKPLDVDPSAQFIFDVQWTTDVAGPAAQVPGVTIDFEAYGPGSPVQVDDLAFCPEFLYSGDELVGIQDPADLGSLEDWRGDLPGTQFACLADPRSVKIGADTVKVEDQVFLVGDAKMRLG